MIPVTFGCTCQTLLSQVTLQLSYMNLTTLQYEVIADVVCHQDVDSQEHVQALTTSYRQYTALVLAGVYRMVNSYRTLLADGTITASGRPQSGNSRNRIDAGAAAAGEQCDALTHAFLLV
jgi:hypothetical protein